MGVLVAGLPAVMDSGRRKINVARVVFVIKTRRIELDDVHDRAATIAREFFDYWCIALVLGQPLHQLSNNMAQMMNLLLTRDVTKCPTGVLNLLMPRQNLSDRLRIVASRRPYALPPAFPAVDIDGEPYWDGGVTSALCEH